LKLTPWTLTVATFLMVGGIAVSYFFKNPIDRQLTVETKRVYFDGEATTKARVAPQNAPTQGSAVEGVTKQGAAATVNSIDIADLSPPKPDRATRLINPELVPETVPERLITGDKFARPPADAVSQLPPPVLRIEPPLAASQEPKPITPDVDELPQPKPARAIIEKPATEGETKGFVTEQYRSIDRTDVRFVQGMVAAATRVATKPESPSR
jgi:hypothetical protein